MKNSSPLHLLADGAGELDPAMMRVQMPQDAEFRVFGPVRRRWSDDPRITWRGSNVLRVATVLHSLGQPTFMHVLASKCGLSPEETGKALSRLYKKELLTREKKDGGGPKYYRWSMSDAQFDSYLGSAAMTPQDIDPDLRSIFAKIRLLDRLQSATVFGGNPVLTSMIDDYRAVWQRVNAQDDLPRKKHD